MLDQFAAITLLLTLLLISSAAPLPRCGPQYENGQVTVAGDCIWQEQEQLPAAGAVYISAPRSVGVFPALTLDQAAQPGPVVSGYSLTIKRLVLRNLTLAPASGADGIPRLLPLGLFPVAPRNLSMWDVRLVVSNEDFQQYLEFFRKQLRTSMEVLTASPRMITDNRSVLNVPYWSDTATEVFSLTLVSGPCNIPQASALPWNTSLQQFPTTAGCHMRTADNTTLVPLLLREAGNISTRPLLIRLISNVTLGPGLLRAIPIRMPIVLLGMASAVTSVDLAMMVNQLNVSLPTGQVVWQSLVLENLAPGDAVSGLVAPPFSTTVSSNVWSLYCNRSASTCLNLSNVTLVVPSQEELNYQVFMYTMFNSPSPALRELTDFYRSELNTTTIRFIVGPGNDTLTVIRLASTGWDFWYVVSTLRNVVAPRRPLPQQAAVTQKARAGALVYAMQDCDGFESALSSRSTSTRTRMWMLVNNVSIANKGHPECDWPDGNITYSLQLLGPVVHTYSPITRVHPARSAVADPLSPEAIVLGHADANSEHSSTTDAYSVSSDAGSRESGPGSPPLAELYSLSFGYVPSMFQLPGDVQDKHLQIQMITLRQLPQAPQHPTLHGLRRLLQQRPDDSSPIGIWTILLWPFKRTMQGVPITITDSQLIIARPEWEVLAGEARQAASFALQLQGQAGGLTFTGVSLINNNTLWVGSFRAPGIAGSNLWLMPDPEASGVPGYRWPAELFAASSTTSSGGSDSGGAALRAGLGVALGVLGLVGLCIAVWLAKRRQLHTRQPVSAAGDKQAVNAAAVAAASVSAKQAGAGGGFAGSSNRAPGVTALNAASAAAVVVMQPDGPVLLPSKQSGLKPATAGAAVTGTAVAGVAAAAGNHSRQDAAYSKGREDAGSSSTSTPQQAASPGMACAKDVEAVQDAAAGGVATRNGSPASVEQAIAHGLERWNAAVSMTTLQLMQRRLQSNNAIYSPSTGSSSSSSVAVTNAVSQQHQLLRQQQRSQKLRLPSAGLPGVSGGSTGEGDQGLQLHSAIGSGSFATVYLGSWRGKRVAIKVMHLQTNALNTQQLPGLHAQEQQLGQQREQQLEQQLERQRQQNSPPHMAVMESVLSSTMSHPNVVQVFTYMLQPLLVQAGAEGHTGQQPAASMPQPPASSKQGESNQTILGWSLRLVMEFCDKGTLCDALDKRELPHLPGTSFTHPSVVLSLSHDIAAALLHLHSEGIVHGDLKAGNVLLSANPTPGDGCSEQFAKVLEAWTAAGAQPLAAKVSDFGMSLQLSPQDTHATMLARGTPTHMAPEIFMAGHVSKASDVYAYGILLYEILTGRRAFAGVPVALLPHEVAVQGGRPEWPRGMPAGSRMLRKLTEACWADKPQARPAFGEILKCLEDICREPQQQLQAQEHNSPVDQQLEQQQTTAAAAGQQCASTAQPALADRAQGPARKPSKELSWSEVSYGGAGQKQGWS